MVAYPLFGCAFQTGMKEKEVQPISSVLDLYIG
jgi:hypothetical protein